MDSEMNRPPEDGLDRPDIIRVVAENAALKEKEAKPPGNQEERRQMARRPPSLFCRHNLQDGTTGRHSPHKGPKVTQKPLSDADARPPSPEPAEPICEVDKGAVKRIFASAMTGMPDQAP